MTTPFAIASAFGRWSRPMAEKGGRKKLYDKSKRSSYKLPLW